MQAKQEGFPNFFYDLDVTHGGASRRFHDSGSFYETYATTDGLVWSSPVKTRIFQLIRACEKDLPCMAALSMQSYMHGNLQGRICTDSNGVTWETITTDWGVKLCT